MTRKTQNTNVVKTFFNGWHVYQVIVEHNYMAHQGIHDSLGKSLRSIKNESFSILDPGCGDGSLLKKTLNGLPVPK